MELPDPKSFILQVSLEVSYGAHSISPEMRTCYLLWVGSVYFSSHTIRLSTDVIYAIFDLRVWALAKYGDTFYLGFPIVYKNYNNFACVRACVLEYELRSWVWPKRDIL